MSRDVLSSYLAINIFLLFFFTFYLKHFTAKRIDNQQIARTRTHIHLHTLTHAHTHAHSHTHLYISGLHDYICFHNVLCIKLALSTCYQLINEACLVMEYILLYTSTIFEPEMWKTHFTSCLITITIIMFAI